MPTIEVSRKDLEQLIGKKLPEDLDETFSKIKAEIEKEQGDALTIELNDTNRVDLWSVEGIARELKGHLGVEEGVPRYKARKSNHMINAGVVPVRPYIAACVVKGVQLSDEVIKQLMQFQDKIDSTYGRMRKKTSIGLYDFDAVTFPLNYELASPDTEFTPLGFAQKMSLDKILKKHPKGILYGYILEGHEKLPLFTDASGKILSMPPIINSNDLGCVKPEHKNVLVEVTGTNEDAVKNVLALISSTLQDRGGTLYEVTIKYENRRNVTPVFEYPSIRIKPEEINEKLGLELKSEEIEKLLRKLRYNAFIRGSGIDVQVPCYRVDVLHTVDVIEDVAIAYGYNNIQPEMPKSYTTGGLSKTTRRLRLFRRLFTNIGCQEVRNMVFTTPEKLFKNMGEKPRKLVEVENPVNESFTCLRNNLLPGLIATLSKNTHSEYPQKIFETGKVVVPDTGDTGSRTILSSAMAIASSDTDFSQIKQHFEWLAQAMSLKYSLKPCKKNWFIKGRSAEIIVDKKTVGYFGEINPEVLEMNQISMPVTGLEMISHG